MKIKRANPASRGIFCEMKKVNLLIKTGINVEIKVIPKFHVPIQNIKTINFKYYECR